MAETSVRRETLPNGLTLLLRELHVAPVAAVQVWAGVGSADERPGELGLAHFYEHMLFKGTPRRPVGEIAGEIEGVGGRMNAYTSHDVTVYHATLPSRELATGVDVLADMVRNPLFEPEEIAREIDVVLEEIRRANDSPSSVLGDCVFEASYGVHPYRSPILGPPESVSAFERGRVADFFRRWYGPDNLTVAIVGDVDPDAALALVQQAFGDAVPSGVRRARPAEPERRGVHGLVWRRRFDRAGLEICWPVPGFAHPDAPLLDLLGYVLGGGESSRLVQHVKEHAGLADRIDASAYTPLDPGLFGVSVDAEAPKLEDAVEAIARELERIRRAPVSGDELERARVNFLASEHFERESVGGIARKIGSFELLAGDFAAESRYLDAIRAASPGDLLRVARQWLAPDQIRVGAVVPDDPALAFDMDTVASALGRGFEATARAFTPPARRAERADVVSYALPGGIALHVVPRPEVPVVALRASCLGGLYSEDAQTAGISHFLASMWLRGTEIRSAVGLARAIEDLAADIDGFAGRSSMGLTLDCTAEQLTPALELFSEVLLRPAFDEEEIERERRETLAALARREDRPGDLAFDLFLATLFRKHPYRHPLRGMKATVGRFDEDMLRAHQERFVRGEGLVIGASGAVDPDALAADLAQLLVEIPSGDYAPPAPADEPPPAEPQRMELRKPREQAHYVIGFRGLTVRDEDRFALDVLSQLLAGQGGSLFLELRDKQGLAYAVNAVNVEGMAPGFFLLYIGTAPEKLDQAEAGMRVELERVLQSPPDPDALDRARRHLAGNFEIDLQRSATRAAHLSIDALYGLGADADRSYVDRILAVSGEDVLRVARRVVDLGRSNVALVRP